MRRERPAAGSGPDPASAGDGATFADAAVRLAGLAGVLFGWRPGEFWTATPAELAALLAALTPVEAAPPDAGMIARLREAYPDG